MLNALSGEYNTPSASRHRGQAGGVVEIALDEQSGVAAMVGPWNSRLF